MAGITLAKPTSSIDPLTGKPRYTGPTTPSYSAPAPQQPTQANFGTPPPTYAPPPSVAAIPGNTGASSAQGQDFIAQERAKLENQLYQQQLQQQVANKSYETSAGNLATGRYGDQLNPNSYGPSGPGSLISQDTFEDHETIRLKHQLANEDADRRFDSLTKLLGESGNKEGAAGYDPAASKAARDAIFARAKDQQGQIARSAIDSLRNVLSESGRLGGGYEDAAMTSVVNEGQGALGEVTREQMIQELADLNRYEDRALTRRGQDMSYRQSLLSLIGSTIY